MGLLGMLTYLGALIFVVALATKMIKYMRMPMHVIWELYPVPHEGKPYGGSFFEEVDHWKKPAHKDHLAQYKFMVPEILLIRALYEHNRPLWYWSFPFHAGLYLCLGGIGLLGVGAVFQIAGITSAIASLVQSLTVVVGVLGFMAGAIGSFGLIVKRLSDKSLSESSAGIDYINLLWLGAIFVTGFLVWLQDPVFAVSRGYLAGLLTFNTHAVSLSAIHVVNLLLFLGFVVYFPFTHMTHMISKYFMWDKVKWDDDQNVGDPGMDAKIKEYLGYPVSWAGPHIESEGKKNWAEVATSNPFSKDAK